MKWTKVNPTEWRSRDYPTWHVYAKQGGYSLYQGTTMVHHFYLLANAKQYAQTIIKQSRWAQ